MGLAIFLATYKSEYIENFFGDGSRLGVKLYISKEEIPLGTAGPVKLLEKELTAPFIVMNGDILSSVNFEKLYNFALNSDTLLTICIKKEITPFAFGNIEFDGDYVTDIQEKPDFINYVLAGIYIFKPEILKLIPHGEYYGMDSLIKYMLKNNLPVSKYELEEYWLDIGRINDYNQAQEAYNEHFK